MNFDTLFEKDLIYIFPELFLVLSLSILLIFGSIYATQSYVSPVTKYVSNSDNPLEKDTWIVDKFSTTPIISNLIGWLTLYALILGSIIALNTPYFDQTYVILYGTLTNSYLSNIAKVFENSAA